MGARGPAKKPAELHKRNATYRPDRYGGPSLRVELSEPPPDLSPGAAAHWHVIGRQLVDAGLISNIDGLMFRMLCESSALYIEAHDAVREMGLEMAVKKGIVSARNKFLTQAYTLAKQFGMTPSARTGLHVESKQEDGDVAAILGFKTAS